MGRKKEISDLTGLTFGRWTVIGEPQKNDSGDWKWLCRCECGTERYVLERTLKHGKSLSCGCLRSERIAKVLGHDLTGKSFGELTVIGQAEHQRKNGGIWWTCRCSCGKLYDVPGTILTSGTKTHCSDRSHERNYASADITGQKFNRLTALYPTDKRDIKRSVIWHCRCDCGNEIDISYNNLVYCDVKSCGCQKKEHDEKLKETLVHISGTSIDMIKSKKVPADNTTGYRGVYLIRGKYVAKIVFQKKAYYLGKFNNIEDAVTARRKAESVLFDEVAEFYEQWKVFAEKSPDWAEANPMQVTVEKDAENELKVSLLPVLTNNT